MATESTPMEVEECHQQEWFSRWPSKLRALEMFRRMLRDHSQDEGYFYTMVERFRGLLQARFRGLIDPPAFREMRGAFAELLGIAGGLPPCPDVHVAHLVRELREALLVDCDFALALAPVESAGCILSCVSGEGWWDIRNSHLLMEDMEVAEPRSILLLKYGFPYIFERRYLYSRCYEIFLRLQLKGVDLSEEVFLNETWHMGSLRLQLALEVLTAVLDGRGGSRDRTILGLMWKTVPHPFVSSTEMFRLLSPFLADFPHELRSLCQEYVERNTVFPVPQVTSPRSLLHLCRVTVRKELLDKNRLCDGAIDSLTIPRTLKGYLRLDSF